MAIPKQIMQLTELALKDRVMTLVEKQTIINAALEKHVPEKEITAYIDEAIRARLEQYSKEDLEHCPHCGAQVPVVSDKCLFCGGSLQSAEEQNVTTDDIEGADADTIHRENAKTENARHDIQHCPDCGAPFPLISNICPYCHHVLLAQKDSVLNVKNMIDNIENSISELKSAPKPTIIDILKYRKEVFCFLISAVLFVMWTMKFDYVSSTCILPSILTLILAFVFVLMKSDTNSPVKIADDKFYNAIHTQEMYSRHIATFYGDDKEVKNALRNYSAEIATQKKLRQKNRNTLTFSVLGLITLVLLLPLLRPSAKAQYKKSLKMNPSVFANAELKSTLHPHPECSVDSTFAPYFKAVSNAELSLEFQEGIRNGIYFKGSLIDVPNYKLRIDNVKLVATGEKIPQIAAPRLKLWDKKLNPVGERFGQITIEIIDDENIETNHPTYEYESFEKFVEDEYWSYYAAFMTDAKSTNIEGLKKVMQEAYYYSIY